MVIEQKFELKQLHLRPVRLFIDFSDAFSKGTYITATPWQSDQLYFYTVNGVFNYNVAILTVSEILPFPIDQRSIFNIKTPFTLYLRGRLVAFTGETSKLKKSVAELAIQPYSDEEIVEEIVFGTNIARALEECKNFKSRS